MADVHESNRDLIVVTMRRCGATQWGSSRQQAAAWIQPAVAYIVSLLICPQLEGLPARCACRAALPPLRPDFSRHFSQAARLISRLLWPIIRLCACCIGGEVLQFPMGMLAWRMLTCGEEVQRSLGAMCRRWGGGASRALTGEKHGAAADGTDQCRRRGSMNLGCKCPGIEGLSKGMHMRGALLRAPQAGG